MDFIEILLIFISAISLIISIANIVSEIFIKSKNQYLKIKINNKNIQISFDSNKKILMEVFNTYLKTGKSSKDSALTILNDYIEKLMIALKDFYPKNLFEISIKRLDQNNNTVYTIATTNPNLSNVVYETKDNTEFYSILNEHYRYFFVSDFDEFNKIYKNSNPNFKSLYKSSIVIPIAKKHNTFYNVLGFICINSTQNLSNTNKNKKILDLIEFTSNKLYKVLLNIL